MGFRGYRDLGEKNRDAQARHAYAQLLGEVTACLVGVTSHQPLSRVQGLVPSSGTRPTSLKAPDHKDTQFSRSGVPV